VPRAPPSFCWLLRTEFSGFFAAPFPSAAGVDASTAAAPPLSPSATTDVLATPAPVLLAYAASIPEAVPSVVVAESVATPPVAVLPSSASPSSFPTGSPSSAKAAPAFPVVSLLMSDRTYCHQQHFRPQLSVQRESFTVQERNHRLAPRSTPLFLNEAVTAQAEGFYGRRSRLIRG
jgi:hypothetical protein